ncbi:DUF3488 and transglutaminase-like domain-containing protein [Actinocrispum wychmicini]|uniref:Transglutaminase superfamily protein n=1 Tax=Actinocrispum wychmicini TaxID=1213861 RepID=A0A4R2IH87_9PSEU|nr:transglutaminase domain-containing protein [Actinocrispum wychmicini]TCO44281.1 transglutaminase superfamily protein [Actinocrispum wychmicini]
MRQRILVACVLLAAAVPGLLFAPVFGLRPLVLPVLVVVLACYVVSEVCVWLPGLRPWRPVLGFVVGLLAVAEVTFGGVPTGATLRAVGEGLTRSWQLTLQSTWPARPDAELLFFVPMIVLLAAVLGVELLRWPTLAVVPSGCALVLSQAFAAVSGTVATVVGLAYAMIIAGVFMASRRGAAVLIVPTVVLGVAAAVGVTAVDQGSRPAYSLQETHSTPVQLARQVSPLTEVAARMRTPDTPVFSYTSADPVDRWRIVVLTGFNGVTWTPTDQFRRIGSRIPTSASVTVPTTEHSARISVPAADSVWVPSQAMPASVTGTAPLVDPASGMLALPDRAGAVDYGLSWQEPRVSPDELRNAAIDPTVPLGDLGVIPPGIADLARTATGGQRPSFLTAALLERYLSQNYGTAVGADLPTGSGWPQLRDFLLTTKRGTSEQFAAAYVALARIVGIPARIAVGYRAPRATAGSRVVVHNGDVLAWPEVAVAGVGWVPLDPAGAASGASPAAAGLAQAAAKVVTDLPPTPKVPDPVATPDSPSGPDGPFPTGTVLLGLLALVLLVGTGIPLWKLVRTVRRRRHTGERGVVAAWREARDLLRAHGAAVTAGMTVRDAARTVTDQSVVDGLARLARQMDIALWSGADADTDTVADAWAAVGSIRRGLAGRPLRARIRALFDLRTVRDPSRSIAGTLPWIG